MLPFADRLDAAVRRCRNPVLVGLDPRAESLPAGILADAKNAGLEEMAAAYGRFCRGVIDVVAPLVPAVKPQAAFFEQLGPAGMAVLADVIRYAQQKGLLVILDGKRNDIGSTATAYAQGMLGAGGQSPWGADALTVSPYLGDDSLQPFIDVAAAASRRGLRAGENLEPRRPNASGSRGRRPAAVSPRGGIRRTAGRRDGGRRADTARSGRWSGPPIPPNWPSCGRRCRTRGFSCPASAARAAPPGTWPPPSMPRAEGPS